METKPLKNRKNLVCLNHERNCPWKGWGNSILARNVKFWKCSYCGKMIRDGVPFYILRINSDDDYIFDSEFCEIKMIQKLELEKVSKEKRV